MITNDTPSTAPFPSTPDDYEEMVFLATNDISARTKGRAMPRRNLTQESSVGWVPANFGIGPLGHIVDGIPWGSTGDLRLKPDFNAEHRLTGVPGKRHSASSFLTSCKRMGTDQTNAYVHNFVKQPKPSNPNSV
ncbi:MAG: hypothetical protein ACTHW9_09580 [Canibacter sp.]